MNSIVTLQSDPPQHVSASNAATGERLTFRLGAEEYGIDILRVQEIRGYEQYCSDRAACGTLRSRPNSMDGIDGEDPQVASRTG